MVLILLGFLAVVLVSAACWLAVLLYRRHRENVELYEDWWPAFEREFREYTSRAWAAARESELGGG